MNRKKIKISIVNYTNTLPFKWALRNSPIIADIDLQEDIPSICAQKLKFGQVQLALVPVALLPELETYFIESDYCIGTDGVVDSVKLYSGVPLNEIKSITLDYQSRSSIALTRVLAKFYWKLDVDFMDARPGFEKKLEGNNANVVIGDRTFELNGKFRFEYDLAEEWKKFTGLPFVFAAWVSTEKQDKDFISRFNTALKYGIENCEQAVQESVQEFSITKQQALFYLTKRISYHLDDEKNKAMNLFLEYLKKI